MYDIDTSSLQTWGLGLIVVFNVVGRCGIPLPSSMAMLTVGAMAVGTPIELGVFIAVSYLAALTGDLVAYPLGHKGGDWLQARAAKRPRLASLLVQAEAMAHRWGDLAVLFTRWPLTTLGSYVNLIAGAVEMRFSRYITWCLIGELFWVSLYLSLGYLFADNLDWVKAKVGLLAAGAVALVVTLALLYIWRRRKALSNHL